MARRVAVLACALMLVAGALAVSESKTLPDPTNNFPCSGFDASSAGFYAFQVMNQATTAPTTSQLTFTQGGITYTAQATLTVCGLQSSTPVCTLTTPPPSGQTVIGVMQVTNTVDQSSTCVPLSNTGSTKSTFTIDSNNEVNGSKGAGWLVTATSVDSSVTYTPTVNLKCVDSSAITASVESVTANTVSLTLSSSTYCSYNAGRFVNFLFQHRLFPIILLPISLLFIFFGQKFIKVILFKIGFVFALLLSLATALTLKPYDTWDTKSIYIVGAFALLVSLLTGYLVAKLTKLYFMVAGGFLGYMLSMKAFELVVLATSKSSNTVQLVTTVSCIIIGVVVGLCIHDHVLIISTAFGGAYLLTFSVGLILKNYPDMDNLPNFKKIDLNDQLVKWFLIYTAGWLFFGVLGAYVQYQARAARNKRKEDGDANEEDQVYFDQVEQAGFYNMNTGYYQAPRPKNAYI